jgi:hypothetical protein
MASKATDAGSAPSLSERTTGTPTRAPQVSSWSAAAARKVSAAPIMTCLPSETKQSGQFARSGGLAGAVHADHDDDARLVRTFLFGIEAAVRTSVPTSFSSLSFSAARTSAGSDFTSDAGVGAQVIDQLLGSIRADVGKQQCVFDVFPVGLGEIDLWRGC